MKVNSAGSAQVPVADQPRDKQEDKLLQACRDFESYLLEQVFRQMRATVLQSGLTERSFSREIFEGWQDEAFTREMARAGGIGLANELYRQLQGDPRGTINPAPRDETKER
jgi:flagellar protein FlgJ